MSQLVLVLSIIGLPRCERELGGFIVSVIVQSARQESGTLRSGYDWIRLGNGPDRADPAEDEFPR